MDRSLSRRSLLRGIAGITASGILLPSEETVRRFWQGWRAPVAAADLSGTAMPWDHLRNGEIVFLLDDHATGSGAIGWWTGSQFVRAIPEIFGELAVANEDDHNWGYETSGFVVESVGFQVIDMARYQVSGR